MEKLKLNLSPIGGRKFRIYADKYGEEESLLPFSDGDEDSNLFTVLNALNTFNPKYEHHKGNDKDWMVRAGILCEDQRFFHEKMRKNIGQKLYEALFPDKIKEVLDEKLGQTGSGQDLHIQIQYDADAIQESRLSLYPWQLVHHKQEFLAKRQVILSYLIAHKNCLAKGTRKVKQIKVLLIPSTASEEDNQRRQNKESIIRNGLKKAEEEGHACLLNWYDLVQEKPTYKRLSDYLTDNINDKDKLPDIIHFDGHGVFKKQCTNPLCSRQDTNEVFYFRNENRCTFCETPLSEPKGFLLFEDDERNPDYISAEKFANLVAISKPVLVVITACKSALAHQSESVFNGIAQSVLREVPAVVATPFSISEDSTTNFVEQFYRVLGAKQSLLKAVQLASQVMHYYDYEWYRPVIFLRHEGDEDGYLFEFVDLPETNLAINSERGVGLQLSNSKTGGQKILLPDPFMDEETFNHDIKFTGRDDEKKKLEEWLIDQHHNQKIVVISGTSGVGKSTLACEFALQNKKDFPDGIYGVRVNEERFADSKDLPAEIAKEFLTELGLKLDENINNRQIIKKMKECFANREALLIFDNVETDRIIKLFPSGKSSIIVTTTNKTLYKELRNCKPLQLLLPNEVDSQDLEERKRLEKDSLDLFKNLVEEERRNEITQKESTAKEILNLIGYLPLVVKVISRLLNKTNKDLLSLERCLKKLTDERNRWQYLKPNHKSENNKKELDVGYSFALALKDLNPEIQEIFACLGACANSRFSLDLISKTAGFSKDLAEDYLRELEDNYFVKQYYVNEREIYFIPTHNLIHDFAKFLLDKKVDYLGVSIPKSLCRDAKNNHANYFINLVDTDELATQEISKRLYQDIDNLKLACDWLAEPENFNNCNGNYKFIFNESWYAVVNSYRLNNFFIKIIQSFYRTGKKVQLDSYELIELRLKEIRFLRNKHLSKDEISNLEKIGKDIEEKIKNDTKKRVSKIRYSKNIAGLYQRQKKNGINYLLDDAEEAITESIQYLTELDKDKNKNESILKEIKQLGWSDFNSWEMAHCLRRQGLILQRKGKKEKQEQYFIDSIVSFKKSLNIYISIQPDKVPFIQGQLGEAYLELAEVQQDQNQQESVNSFKEAKNFLLQSLNGYRQEQFENVNSISIVLKNLGKTYLALGDLTKAEQYLIESIENDKKLNENGINGRIVPGKELKELIKEYAKQQRSFKNIESLLHQFPNDDRGQVIFLNELADNYIMPKNDENNYENAEKIFFK